MRFVVKFVSSAWGFCYVDQNFDVLRIILKLPRVTAIKNLHEQTEIYKQNVSLKA